MFNQDHTITAPFLRRSRSVIAPRRGLRIPKALAMIELQTLGGLDLRTTNGRSVRSLLARPKRLALLAYLAVAAPGGFCRRDTLLGLFWPDLDEDHARAALRKSLHVLRQVLGAAAVTSCGDDEIGVERTVVSCDAALFLEAEAKGRTAEALDWYGGDFLPGFFLSELPEFEQWVEATRQRFRLKASHAWVRRADEEEQAGRLGEAARCLERALALEPDDERVLRRLAELLGRQGDRAAAVRIYEQFSRRLRTELELEPSAETRALMGRLRADDGAAPEADPRTLTLPAPGSTPAARGRRRVPVTALALAAGFVLGLGMLLASRQSHSAPEAEVASEDSRRVAVLPFENLGDSSDGYFADGIADEVRGRLSQMAGLAVIARASSNEYRHTTKSPQQIAHELGVAYLLTATIRWEKGPDGTSRVRVSPELVKVAP